MKNAFKRLISRLNMTKEKFSEFFLEIGQYIDCPNGSITRKKERKRMKKKTISVHTRSVEQYIKLCSLHEIGKSTGEEKMRQNKYFEY